MLLSVHHSNCVALCSQRKAGLRHCIPQWDFSLQGSFHLKTPTKARPVSSARPAAAGARGPRLFSPPSLAELNLEVPDQGSNPGRWIQMLFCSFLYLMLPFPAQNSPWLPVDQKTKPTPSKWSPWLPRAKPQEHADWQEPQGEGRDDVPAVQGTAGPLPGHETSTLRPSISHESQALMLRSSARGTGSLDDTDGPWFAGSHQEALTKPLSVACVLCCLLSPTTDQQAHLKRHFKPHEHPHTGYVTRRVTQRVGMWEGWSGGERCSVTPAWLLLPALPWWYTP